MMKLQHLTPLVIVGGLALIASLGDGGVEAQGGPSVTGVNGTLIHNSNIVISGSAFGTKTTAAPLKYDDFQSVTVGERVTTSTAPGPPWIGGGSQTFNPIASTSRLRPSTPFTRNMQSHWRPSGPGDASASNIALTGQTFRKIYFDAWMYNDTSFGGGMDGGENVKHIRVHQAGATAPNVGFTDTGPGGNNFFCIAGDGKFNDFTMTFNPMNAATMYNSWMHIQWAIDAGSGGQATNGKVRIYVNGSLRCTSNSASLLNTGFTSWPEIYIGNYWRTQDYTGDVYAYWESIYVDNSWARIEIGNNSVYTNCTIREVQIPSAWSNTSVTVKVNRGQFSDLNSLFLFVVDENGVASPGFPLTGVSSGPAKPTNLRVTPG
jgi:hypothetical protein